MARTGYDLPGQYIGGLIDDGIASADLPGLYIGGYRSVLSGTWKTTLGLATASHKTVVGLARASIKTFQGLTP